MISRLSYLWNDYKKTLDLLCRISSRSRLYLAVDMFFSVIFRMMMPSEYSDFGFDFIPRSTRKDYLTYMRRKRTYKRLSARSARKITESKYYQASVLRDFFRREFLHSPTMTKEEFLSFVQGKDKFIYKPLTSSRTTGQRVYHLDGSRTPEEIFEEIKGLRGAILEEWIPQHEALSALYPDAVHIVRIHTVHGESTDNIRIYRPFLSVAYAGEIANTSLDTTLSAQVDLNTGIVITDLCDLSFNLLSEVPGSGIPIQGYQLPDWDKVLDLVRRAAARIPEIRLIGWDIAFTPDGPIIVEGNAQPDQIDIQSRTWVKEGITGGVWPIIKPYLK